LISLRLLTSAIVASKGFRKKNSRQKKLIRSAPRTARNFLFSLGFNSQ
jgi:hypothetical protein